MTTAFTRRLAAMKAGVLCDGEALQVRQAIVIFDVVPVVDVVSRRNRAMLGFPLQDMLRTIFAVHKNQYIAALVVNASALPRRVQRAATVAATVAMAFRKAEWMPRVLPFTAASRARDCRWFAASAFADASGRLPAGRRGDAEPVADRCAGVGCARCMSETKSGLVVALCVEGAHSLAASARTEFGIHAHHFSAHAHSIAIRWGWDKAASTTQRSWVGSSVRSAGVINQSAA